MFKLIVNTLLHIKYRCVLILLKLYKVNIMMTKDERIRFYKSKEWQITRKRVLERDNYECQQCKRDGKLTTYDKSKRKSLDVDHILSLEHHPEFAHDLNNLETLCIKCHNKKEKRFIKKENKWKDEKW